MSLLLDVQEPSESSQIKASAETSGKGRRNGTVTLKTAKQKTDCPARLITSAPFLQKNAVSASAAGTGAGDLPCSAGAAAVAAAIMHGIGTGVSENFLQRLQRIRSDACFVCVLPPFFEYRVRKSLKQRQTASYDPIDEVNDFLATVLVIASDDNVHKSV